MHAVHQDIRTNSKVDAKVVFLGNSMAGKTSLINRYLKNTFGPTQSTVGVAFGSKKVSHQGRVYNLGLWDTGGMERFDSLNSFYTRKANIAVLCFDLTSRESFTKLTKWHSLLAHAEPNCVNVIVGCKLDLVERRSDGKSNRAVAQFECQAQAAALNAAYFETSAKDGTNIQQVFEHVVEQYAMQCGDVRPAQPPSSVDLQAPIMGGGERGWGSCCYGS